jgi:hypothetical protein
MELPMSKRFMPVLLAALALASSSAIAQTQKLYRWVDEKGRVYYTDRMPVESAGRPADILDKQGSVLKRQETALTPEQVEERERLRKKKEEDALVAREERRKNMALLSTYTSEKDIDDARERALKDARSTIEATENRIAENKKRQEDFNKEKEFFQKKPMPQKLEQDIRNNETDLKNQLQLLEAKKKEYDGIDDKYAADKRRYLELTKGSSRAPSRAEAKK